MSIKDKLYIAQLGIRQRLASSMAKNAAPSPAFEPSKFSPKKILFVLSGLIGDSVMSMATIEAGRKLWPAARIIVLGKKHNRELISACAFYDEFYECNADPFSLRRSAEVDELERWLRAENFDAAFILLGDQFAHLLARAGIPYRVGVRGTRLESCLTHTYDIGSARTWGVRERKGALRSLGFNVGDHLPRLCVDERARSEASRKLEEFGLTGGTDYIFLHPFGSTRRQWWPLENVSELAAAAWRYSLTVVLAGGEEISLPVMEPTISVVNTTGKLTLPELIAVIDDAKLVVTTDSGPFHIAGALGKPIIGLFRSRRPEHAGQYPGTKVVFGENAECMIWCEWDRCRSEPCRQMQNISLQDVIRAVEERLAPA